MRAIESARVLGARETFDAAAYVVSLVFLWSGSAKIRKPELAGLAIQMFGLTRRPSRRLGLALGLSESALGIAVASRMRDEVVLGAAALVLWSFTILLCRSLIRGDRHACFCFGTSDSRVSLATLLRTVALAAIATGLTVWASSVAPATAVAVRTLEVVIASSLLALAALLVNGRKLWLTSADDLAFRR
jgi:hypothetical protein